jgi:hypothetical protein
MAGYVGFGGDRIGEIEVQVRRASIPARGKPAGQAFY